MKEGYYYKFKSGNIFKIVNIKNGLCRCETINKYDVFYMEILEGELLLFEGELEEIHPSKIKINK